MYPELDGRTVNIVHFSDKARRIYCTDKIAVTSAWTIYINHPLLFHKIVANQSARWNVAMF